MENKVLNESWIHDKLSALLEFPVPPDYVDYICSIDNDRDFTEYFSTLLNLSNPEHAKFVTDLKKILIDGESISQQQDNISPEPTEPVKELKIIKKSQILDFEEETHKPSKKKVKSSKSSQPERYEKETENDSNKQKKTKYVNLYSQEGQAKDVVLLKGRHSCNCEASKHLLINNCLKCGRIVCEQEGAGPCLFCGNLVCTPEQQQQLNAGSKRSEKLRDHLMKQTASKDTEIALQKRDRLLEYDKTSERLTKVIDDESDYYNPSSVWLSAEEKARVKKRESEVHDQLHASRRDMKITLDFSGRSVIEEQPELPIDPFDDPILKRINQSLNNKSMSSDIDDSNTNPLYDNLQFLDLSIGDTLHKKSSSELLLPSRIQDRELQEMSDHGMCLSMHQPWASLLVAGIKIHEGRSWYTPHRGTLWIAAAAKQTTQAEIQAEERHIREAFGNPRGIKFPTQYPVGCLLGSVNVVDCLSQDEYRIQYPNGPSMEPFVFICEHPRKLPICFPLKGKHKIFKLDTKIHQAAQKSLKRVAKLVSEMTAE